MGKRSFVCGVELVPQHRDEMLNPDKTEQGALFLFGVRITQPNQLCHLLATNPNTFFL